MQCDAIARLAAAVTHAPLAVVSVGPADHLQVAGAHGLDDASGSERGLALLMPLCERIAVTRHAIVAEDIRRDPQLAGVPAVDALHAAAYAGVPLQHEGQTLGSLCAVASTPRSWSPEDLRALEDLASLASAVLVATDARGLLEGAHEQAAHLRRMEALDRFAGGIVHDFNNLLTGMQLQLQLLADSAIPRGDLAALAQCVEEGTRLTSHLLSLTRKRQRCPRPVPVDDTIGAVAPLLRRAAGSAADFLLEAEAPAAVVVMDLGEFQQVLLNLVANARDALEGRGSITIRTATVLIDAPDPTRILPPPPGKYVRIEVRDTGHGVPPALRRQIFDPFFTTRHDGHAQGLGLTVVFAIVRAAGGGIDVQSGDDATTFSVYLPLESGERAETVRAGETFLPRAAGRPTVLLVDDDDAVRMLVARQLAREGLPVLTAANAAEALVVARQHAAPVDVLVTDVNLPVVSGVRLAEQLISEHAGLRVVLITGNAQEVGPSPLPAAHLAGVLQKPFSAAKLLRLVDPPRPRIEGTAEG